MGSPANDLPIRIRGARRLAIVGVGDELSLPDRLGMVAAREVEQRGIFGVRVFLAGTVPESITGPLKRFRPDHILFFDAADMGIRPGSIALIEPDQVRASLVFPHALPLTVVMDYLWRETGAGTSLVGIQPDLAHGGGDLSSGDREYLDRNLEELFRIIGER
jgi:hydrogenase 3 maturation protease